VQDQYSFVHDALVEFIRSGGETEVKDVNVAQYVRQLTTPADNGDTPLHTQYQVLIHCVFFIVRSRSLVIRMSQYLTIICCDVETMQKCVWYVYDGISGCLQDMYIIAMEH